MGGVVVSPNIKRESVRIDTAGNVINPRTKAIVTPVEVEVSPVKVEPVAEPIVEDVKPSSKIDDMISKLVEKKVEEMVAKKVEEALSNL